ncbi:GGDEF domain-containing protein [Alcaligenaceae bacterium]|nr:GGDEF domain-containing protein [Alcaligenaceae bacterium]
MVNRKPKELSKPPSRIDLRHLILWMCLFFVIVAVGNSLHAAYRVQHGLLLQHSADTNRDYAGRLAQLADSFLRKSAQAIEAAALDVAESGLDPAVIRKELDQLASITDAFNTIIAVDSSGKITAARPESEFSVGAGLQAFQARQLLDAKEATAISGALKGPGGQWLSIIAHPIFSPHGSYAGFVGGAVHLQGSSALQNALDQLHYQDGSYFYIVDEKGTIAYHPNQRLIGLSLKDTQPVQMVLRGQAGTQRVDDTDSHGQLVSYAPISFANWGVVTHRPIEVALSNIAELLLKTFYYSLPLLGISLLAIWWLSRFIAFPLRELAEVAANMDDRANFSRICFIKSWYVEAAMIQKALMHSFSAVSSRIRKLRVDGSTDPLTGLINRRGLDIAIDKLTRTAQTVAVVMIDLDYFKAVNDKFGHAVGDEVLKAISVLIMAEARREDVVARMGGEEFVILLPETDIEAAMRFAERLQSTIERASFDNVGRVTISLGVACYPTHGDDIHESLVRADAALYRAKAAGRNCLRMA